MNQPFVLVIFGATGDLSRNKLLPALFSLFKQNMLPKEFFIVGFSRRDLSHEAFRELVSKHVKEKEVPLYYAFLQHLFYQQGMFDDPAGYANLTTDIKKFDDMLGTSLLRVYYLATPPDNYETILNMLNETKLANKENSRVAIEKPFGKDLETAIALDEKLATIFNEEQIFRVDHYLGKDTVQNMITFRFANSMFEPIWNSQYIDHIQITNAETTDVAKRGKFFDGVGNLRDWGQNHLMQLAAAVGMEQPRSFSKEGVRDARANFIQSIRTMQPEEVTNYVVRGQYEGYRDVKNVNPLSNTETYVALKMFFDTPRFKDVPFYARLGKNMKEDIMQVHVVFKQTCHILFKEFGCPEIGNVLTFTIQPEKNEGIAMHVIAKQPGTTVSLKTVNMSFSYQHEFGRLGAGAYERLLIDIFIGDQMLFNRSDELESSWNFITHILSGWERSEPHFPNYRPGSWGPMEAKELIERDGRKWI